MKIQIVDSKTNLNGKFYASGRITQIALYAFEAKYAREFKTREIAEAYIVRAKASGHFEKDENYQVV